MSALAQRQNIQEIVDAFFVGWCRRDWGRAKPAIAPHAELWSSQHGDAVGPDGFEQALAGDTACGPVWFRTSNRYIGGRAELAVASAYVFGLLRHGTSSLLFGATVVMTFRCTVDGTWLLTTVRLAINWQQGNTALVSHWHNPPEPHGWQLGDAPPVLVSELDSPWSVVRDSILHGSIEDTVTELYSKYSWAIDQGDIALLSDCFSEEAAGGFAPMGALSGRHAIIGQLKSFRRHWPWMQHFADVVRVELEQGDTYARMIVARVIPERPVDATGRALYGAHYQIRARLEPDRQWRICWSDYRPGWFAENDLPEFDIGRTTEGT
ncbi:nuclear transport factor 2 family protein [Paraburkholderia nemoris]|uniref:nuclear transport factor 2 family protein n=1 Tax=Paraburkholderia nemoris TaxID=2793076 RepID=UPI0038B9AF9E